MGWPQLINLCNFGPGMAAPQWWEQAVAGVTPLAAYAFRGASSYVAAKKNLVPSGLYNNTENNGALVWSAANGLELTAAASKSLSTGIAPQAGDSMMLVFSNVTDNGCLAGSRMGTATEFFWIYPNRTPGVTLRYGYGAGNRTAPFLLSGNLAIAADKGYRNGVDDLVIAAIWTGPNTQPVFIGALNNNGAAGDFVSAYLYAMLYYRQTLTATQVASAYVKMQATFGPP